MNLPKTLTFLSMALMFTASAVLWCSPAQADMFVNLGNSQFKNWCLNVRGDNGRVTVEPEIHTGCNWSILPKSNNRYQLVNLGNSSYNGWFLNVRGDNGAVTVESKAYSGTYWRIVQKGNDRVQLVNLGNSPYNGWVLNVAGETGAVTVYPQQPVHSGTFWLMRPWLW